MNHLRKSSHLQAALLVEEGSLLARLAAHQKELDTIFATAPLYAAHESGLPAAPSYFVPSQFRNAQALIRRSEGFHFLSNTCAHRQAILLEGEGALPSTIRCRGHGWNYRHDGSLAAAPMLSQKPCACLPQTPCLRSEQGYLFLPAAKEGIYPEERFLAGLNSLPSELAPFLDLSEYSLFERTDEVCPFDWKTLIEIYLDLYHVPVIHPGLNSYVATRTCYWLMGDLWSAQMMPASESALKQTEAYQAYAAEANRIFGQRDIEVVWFYLYPNLMVECYPGATVISTAWPTAWGSCVNIQEYFYHQAATELLRTAHQAAYLETVEEDDILCQKIFQGKSVSLGPSLLEESGRHYHPHLEAGVKRFHDLVLAQAC